MKTNPHSTTRSLVLAALFLALAFVLPMITGHVPQVGNMLCPMHFPILLCGFVLGGPWGLAVGFIAPLVRSVLFGMPPMFPIAIAMAFELAAYGLVSGVLWHKVKHTVPMMYASLVTAMVAGRLVWGAVRFVLAGLTGSSFPFSAFLSGALLTAVPGIVAQLVLIPLILDCSAEGKVYGLTYYLGCPPLCSATATTAACGRNKEEPLGLRPAGCECRLRHEADTGSRNPNIFSGNFIFIITEEQRLRPLLFCFFTGGAVMKTPCCPLHLFP